MCVPLCSIIVNTPDAPVRGPWTVGTIRIAMAAIERVEVSGLVRRMARHPGEARLLEVEDARARDLIGRASCRHQIVRAG